MLLTVVCLQVVGMFHVMFVLMIQLADTVNSEKPDLSGLPLLYQIIQVTHGSCISTTDAWTAAISLTSPMSVV